MTPIELSVWLQPRPMDSRKNEANWISSRLTARGLPYAYRDVLQAEIDRSLLPMLRALIVARIKASVGQDFGLSREIIGAAAQEADDTREASRGKIRVFGDAARMAADIPLATVSAVVGHTRYVAHVVEELLETNVARAVLASDVDHVLDVNWQSSTKPLWPAALKQTAVAAWQELANRLMECPDDWSFWIDWYQSWLDGTPFDIDLQTEVALIPDEDWAHEDNPAHVLGIIQGIYEKHQLREKVSQLQAELEDLKNGAASAAHRGHNRPPELLEVDDAEEINDRLTQANAEMAKQTPDNQAMREIALGLQAAAMVSVRKLGGYADIFIESALQELGSSAAKWLVRGGALLALAKALHLADLLLVFAGG